MTFKLKYHHILLSTIRIMETYEIERIMRKPAFCMILCVNKGTDSNCTADQHVCFRYIDNIIPLLPKSELLSLFCGCTTWSVSVLVPPKTGFSLNADHITVLLFSTNMIMLSFIVPTYY